MAALRPLIAGNWKMFGRRGDLAEIEKLAADAGTASAEVLICPPYSLIDAAIAVGAGAGVLIGAQDCSAIAADAARTGEVSAAMLADIGATHVIVGHSERRSQHGESDALVRRKAEAALSAGLVPIVCVGETLAQRDAGKTEEVIAAQVRASVPGEDRIIIAYEPVWAIGGDRTPSMEEIADVHGVVREAYGAPIRVLYGGSVGPKNAIGIFAVPGVDGALVGRASLKAADFGLIVRAYPAVT
ncbi:MAG: triose-phosphate isomerase [Terricaulis sp.]